MKCAGTYNFIRCRNEAVASSFYCKYCLDNIKKVIPELDKPWQQPPLEIANSPLVSENLFLKQLLSEACSHIQADSTYLSRYGERVTPISKELSGWWRETKAADAKREAEDKLRKAAQKEQIRQAALSKLTAEEKEALGL